MIPASVRKYVYYEEPDIVILHGDCLEILPLLEDKSIDLTLTDPPYGLGFQYTQFNDTKENLQKLISLCMPEIQRISKRILLTCGQSNITYYPQSTWILAWINKAGANRNSWGFTCWHPILAYGKDPYLEAGMGARQDIIINNEISEKWIDHPCPKPIKLWKQLLTRGSVLETDIILDPFLGSGTTASACKELGRKCICIEIEEKYCQIAVERLKQEVLF